MKYKAVIFDCFGVLYNDWSFDLFEILGDPKKAKRIRTLMDKHDLNEVDTGQYRREIEELSGISFETLVKKLQGNPNKTIIDFTKSLQKNGYLVGLLSNVHKDYLDRLLGRDGLTELFDEVLVSSEIEVMKPDPEIYETMLERMGVSAQEAIFVDDRESNIKGAEAVGLTGIHFKENKQLIDEIEQKISIDL